MMDVSMHAVILITTCMTLLARLPPPDEETTVPCELSDSERITSARGRGPRIAVSHGRR